MAITRLLRCLLVVVVSVGLCLSQSRDSYCRISQHHTMCRFTGPSPSCGEVLRHDTSPTDRELIVNLHNELRSYIATGQEREGSPGPQPPAANMRMLYWDDELAAVAQRWADQCRFQHECGECREVARFGVGQNLYASMSGASGLLEPRWNQAIMAWYEEVRDFSRHDVDHFPQTERMIGHYTAIVWAKTSRIGCGFTNYVASGRNTRIYICNYGEGGNIITLPVYRRGEPCSACPAGTTCSSDYPGLCTEDGGQRAESSTHSSQQSSPFSMQPASQPSSMQPQSAPQKPSMMPEHMQSGSMHMMSISTQSSGSTMAALNVPNPGEMTSLPPAEKVNAYTVRPDPNSGCFRIKDLLICVRGKEGVIVLKKA